MKTTVTTEDEKAVRDVLNNVIAAFNEKDLEKLLSLHTDDIILMEPGIPLIQGKKRVREMFADFEKRKLSIKLSFTIDELEVNGSRAFARGQVFKQSGDVGKKPVNEIGKFITLLKKQEDGNWLRSHVIVNMDEHYDNLINSKVEVKMGVADRVWKN